MISRVYGENSIYLGFILKTLSSIKKKHLILAAILNLLVHGLFISLSKPPLLLESAQIMELLDSPTQLKHIFCSNLFRNHRVYVVYIHSLTVFQLKVKCAYSSI